MVQKFLTVFSKKIVLHFLPPYCPESNPIEKLWKQFHDNVTRNHTCKNIDELLTKSEAFLFEAIPFPGAHPSIAKAA
jgi:transposase